MPEYTKLEFIKVALRCPQVSACLMSERYYAGDRVHAYACSGRSGHFDSAGWVNRTPV